MNKDYETRLHFAEQLGRLDLAILLIDHGANAGTTEPMRVRRATD